MTQQRKGEAMSELPVTTASIGKSRYAGPERRAFASMAWRWLTATLDEIDYGVLLLDERGRSIHVNHVARRELDEKHPLHLPERELRARRPSDAALLQAALDGCMQRGLRKLLTLGEGGQQVCVSVVPLERAGPEGQGVVLVMLGKRQVCAELAVQGFARHHELTPGETRVLMALCAGAEPAEAAEMHGVAISTVRTQIGSIRTKTGASSIRALVRRVAVLPPLMGVLRGGGLAQNEAPIRLSA